LLKLIPRRKSTNAPPAGRSSSSMAEAGVDVPRVACALSACLAGERATVLEVRCGDLEACRLRTLGLCEGAAVNVVRSRDCTLLEVRGSRLAVSHLLASDITVLPVA
jgi:ferrous iron transport protein A